MRLYRLHLQNFRQFRQETLEFAAGNERNVTVIHGQNGSGKTTLNNAFKWLFYEESGFELRPGKLASQGALAEIDQGETVDVEVTLEFEDEGTDYTLTRTATYQKQSPDDYLGEVVDTNLRLQYETPDGDRGQRNNPQRSVERMLPERLSELFFFDGEYITELSKGHSGAQVKEAIQNIMGLTIIERSIRHLGDVGERFEDEVKAHADNELSEMLTQREELRERATDLEDSIGTKEDSRERLRDEIEDINTKLEGIEETAELQKRYDELTTERDEVEDKIEDINDQIDQQISKHGALPFAMPAIEATAQDLDDLREQGEIPSEVSNQFVEKLLTNGECICGRPLEEGTHPYASVEAYRSDVASNGVDQAAIRIISHLTSIQDEQTSYREEIDSLLEQRTAARDRRTEITDEIDEIEGDLDEMDQQDAATGETPSELQAARTEKRQQRERLQREIGNDEQELETVEAELEEIDEEISEARQDATEAELARKRMQATAEVRNQLEASFEQLQGRVRTWSNDLVKQTFDDIATKEFEAEITDEFELKIRDQLSGGYMEVEQSRGERQVSSLAFIGSLVQVARERYEAESDHEYFSGGIYPIVMDSPFGALDDDHRRTVSKVIPKMAEQVVVLVTDSQWRGPVASEMNEIANQQYRLEFQPGDGETTFPHTVIVDEPVSSEVEA